MKSAWTLLAVVPALLPALAVGEAEEDAFLSALKQGSATLDMRLRLEAVDNDIDPPPGMKTDEAAALTLRTRLGYLTGSLGGFDAYGEVEDTHVVLGLDDYQARSPDYGVIADPTGTGVNQAFVRYRGSDLMEGLMLVYGRQRIIYDNARFIGNVGWRQNEQTFDGTRVDYRTSSLALSAAYLTSINTILGTDAAVRDTLLNGSWLGAPGGTLTAYAYLLEPKQGDGSLDTWGLRYGGQASLPDVALLATAEYARQTNDPGTGLEDAEANYYFLEAGVLFSGVTLKVAREVLGSDDGGYGFETPLATKHAFNGWADKFLATPAVGLQDTFVTLSGSLAGIGVTAVWHDFAADESVAGSADDFGSELDLQATKKLGAWSLGLKFARFSADRASTFSDTDKVWVWTGFGF